MRRINWQARKQAERAFTAIIRIERDTGKTVYDPETFTEKPQVIPVWNGAGKISTVKAGADADIVSAPVPSSSFVLHVPFNVPVILDGDIATVVEDRHGGMAGRVFTVVDHSRSKTHVTAQRIPIEEVTMRGDRH